MLSQMKLNMIGLFILSWKLTIVTTSKILNYADEGTCGKVSDIKPRIVGGDNAEKAEFPWLVSLTRRGGHICGGTIISETFILTAGHCLCSGIDEDILSPKSLKVSLSQHDLGTKNSDAFSVDVKDIFVHPGYKCNHPIDDIAILELNHRVRWSLAVAPACLGFMDNRDEFDDMSVTVAGWGWTNEDHGIGQRANILQKAKVNVINIDKCREWYKPYENRIKLKDTQMCAGHENGGIDACWVDSGGPLMYKSETSGDQLMVIGVVSTGIGCGRKQLPGIYTRISDYIPWIEKVMRK